MEYIVDDHELNAEDFITLANSVWPGNYDLEEIQKALKRTINITAYAENCLIGCIRILSDGYFFGTITELIISPEFQKKGIGSKLLNLAKIHTPSILYFGAQPEAEEFYEKNGCEKSLQSYIIQKSK
ncbi:GNAT family N-acetyltransferase [Anaerostipes caccae]|uniref:GNAT family N-acetyltransferase n=1 Tax=Anaerostipes caccae TaxID=105841 RepID=UPI0038D4B97F